ncbi:unnamed protein product, partial [Thlaspi arvense]
TALCFSHSVGRHCLAHGCFHVAVGLNNSQVQLWDSVAKVLVKTLEDFHHDIVGSLAQNNDILTIRGLDGHIINNDVQISSHVVGTYKGHTREIYGLKWSGFGQKLASGGNNNVVHIWDRSRDEHWLHRLRGHTSVGKSVEIRQAAGLLLKNNLKGAYPSMAQDNQKYIKSELLPCLGAVDRHIRTTVGTIISVIVHIEGVSGWPELLPALVTCLDSNDLNHMDGAMDALSKENLKELLPRLIPVFLSNMAYADDDESLLGRGKWQSEGARAVGEGSCGSSP